MRADAGEEAPRVGGCQLEQVLVVARRAPPAAREQQRLVLLDLAGSDVERRVLGLDVLRRPAPDLDLGVVLGRAEALPLVVRLEVEADAREADCEDGEGGGPREA